MCTCVLSQRMHEIVLAYSYLIFGPTTRLQIPFQKAVSKFGHSKQPKECYQVEREWEGIYSHKLEDAHVTCYTLLDPQLQDATKPMKKKTSTTFCETRKKREIISWPQP